MKTFLDQCQIELIENFPCDNRFQLKQRIKLYYAKLSFEKSIPINFIKYANKCNNYETNFTLNLN